MTAPLISGHRIPDGGALGKSPLLSAFDVRLLMVALIWGFDFVAQRQGVQHVGAFFFNAACFGLGSLMMALRRLRNGHTQSSNARLPGILTGVALFAAISLQTIGMVTTSAGKAAFITSLYLVLVPIGSRLFGTKICRNVWIGCLLALAGLYFLCAHGTLAFSFGDILVLVSAFFWTTQILTIDHFAPKVDGIDLAFWQFLSCALLSLVASLLFETTTIASARIALLPILYNGIISAGIAYSLQISGQGGTTASRAAILLSLETVFAAIGGWLLLGEHLGPRELFGCALMLAGTLISQVRR